MYVAFLGVVRQQLALGLGQLGGGPKGRGGGGNGNDDSSGSGSDDDEEGGAAGDGACPLGLPFVEELLPDSFLRRQFGSFFEMLHDAGGATPPQLVQQVGWLWQHAWQARSQVLSLSTVLCAPECPPAKRCHTFPNLAPSNRRPSWRPCCATGWAGTTACSRWAGARTATRAPMLATATTRTGRWWSS
jgi:hypothetical protein